MNTHAYARARRIFFLFNFFFLSKRERKKKKQPAKVFPGWYDSGRVSLDEGEKGRATGKNRFIGARAYHGKSSLDVSFFFILFYFHFFRLRGDKRGDFFLKSKQ